MEHRTLGRTGRDVSVVGLGTWQLGADWGEVSESDARAVLEAAVEHGVTFLDTADVYGDGRSEQVIGRFLADHPELDLTVATKMGRRAEQVPAELRPRALPGVDRPLAAQPRRRHPPAGAAALPALRGHRRRRDVRRAGHPGRRRRDRGVRRERRDRRPGARRDRAPARRVGADHPQRVPPQAAGRRAAGRARRRASGSSPGCRWPRACCRGGTTARPPSPRTTTAATTATAAPSTSGETFSGVDYETGLVAAAEFTELVAGIEGLTPAQAAIAWAWQQPGVTHRHPRRAQPGARRCRTPRPGRRPRCPGTSSTASAGSTTSTCARRSIRAGDHVSPTWPPVARRPAPAPA